MNAESDDDRNQRGVQSIEVGGQILLAMVHSGRPLALKDLAREAGMPAAKAHGYLVSFGRIGLVEQDAATGRYALGPLALQLGMIGLKQANPVQAAAAVIADLAQHLGHTVAVSVWGSRGPTIVRLEESPAAIHVNMRHGTVFSLSGTATGRLFAAFLAPEIVQPMLDEERRRAERDPPAPAPGMPATPPVPSWRDLDGELAEVRARGLSRTQGETLPGIHAMAAPIFDFRGTLAAAITAIGPAQIFDVAWDGRIALALRAGAAQVSLRLGAPAAALRQTA